MEWLTQNWLWVVIFAGFVAMHLFGHGGHGGHGSGGCGGAHGAHRPADKEENNPPPPGSYQH